MLDLVATLLSSLTSFLLPIFASYKALKTADPAQLTLWLMYWVVFNCCLLVESWLSLILAWVPLYAYARFFFLLYLVLPQTQGARHIYEDRIHPFLEDNEAAIDDLIAGAHHRVRAAGATYLRRAVEWLRTTVLGLPPSSEPPAAAAAPPPAPQGYTQALLARFSVPTARWASAVSAATRAAPDLAAPIPPDVRGSADRMTFIAAQRERLAIVLSALDREAQQLQRDAGAGLTKSRSETDFEKVEAESGAEEEGGRVRHRHASGAAGGPWMPWAWGGGQATPREE